MGNSRNGMHLAAVPRAVIAAILTALLGVATVAGAEGTASRAPGAQGAASRGAIFQKLRDQGQRAMVAGDFDQALRCFEQARDTTSDHQARRIAEHDILRSRSWIATRDARAAVTARHYLQARAIVDSALVLPLTDEDRARLASIATEVRARGRIDVAIALTRQGRPQDARTIYRSLLAQPIPGTLKEYVQARLQELDRMPPGR